MSSINEAIEKVYLEKMMYKSNMLNTVLECVVESEKRFSDEWDYYSSIQVIMD